MITSKLTSKARTTIPQPVRTALRLKPGDDLIYVIDGNHALLAKASPKPADSPFRTFSEWDSPADTSANADL